MIQQRGKEPWPKIWSRSRGHVFGWANVGEQSVDYNKSRFGHLGFGTNTADEEAKTVVVVAVLPAVAVAADELREMGVVEVHAVGAVRGSYSAWKVWAVFAASAGSKNWGLYLFAV